MGLTGPSVPLATAQWLSRTLPLPFTDVKSDWIAPRAFFEVIGNEDYLNICDDSLKGADVDARMAAKRAAHEAIGEVYRLQGPGSVLLYMSLMAGIVSPRPRARRRMRG